MVRGTSPNANCARAFYTFDFANTAAINFERANRSCYAKAIQLPGFKYFVVEVWNDITKESLGFLI